MANFQFHGRKMSVGARFAPVHRLISEDKDCVKSCDQDGRSLIPPPPPSTKFPMKIPLLAICLLVAAISAICYIIIRRRLRSNARDARFRNVLPTQEQNDREDLIDENHGPVLDHPIWYIRTIGLPQSVIDSIEVFQYKKGESLIEGTDCSVCLSEFEEDESLRLLPKCSHAFHISCIDTWLRSHKNCPLCRAPIVSDQNIAHEGAQQLNLNESSSQGDPQLEGGENGDGDGDVGEEEEVESISAEDETISELDNERRGPRKSWPSLSDRVLSDLGDYRLKVDQDLQSPRRSISMDSSAAVMVSLAVANVHQNKDEGSSTHNQQPQHRIKQDHENVPKTVCKNSSLYGVMKSYSFGKSLQKMPISFNLKRSISSGNRSFLPTQGRDCKGKQLIRSF